MVAASTLVQAHRFLRDTFVQHNMATHCGGGLYAGAVVTLEDTTLPE